MVELRGLTKVFGARKALAGVDLRVESGEFVTLLGPNGAGKTTLLRIVASLSRPSAGTLRVAGLDPFRSGEDVRRKVGFLSHRTLLYDDLSAEQNLRFYARMYGLQDGQARIDELLQRVGLAVRRHDPLRTLSRGMQQRLALARAVLHRPQLLLLDEPYTGLDSTAARVLADLLAELAGEGTTILLTTHDLRQGLDVGQRVVVLARGRLVYDARREDVPAEEFPALYERLAA